MYCKCESISDEFDMQTVISAMLTTEQMPGMSVMRHGDSVHNHYLDLLKIIKGEEDPSKWKLPEWVYDKRILEGQMDSRTMRLYQIYHDCGKPFCRSVDEDGKQHFYNHAQISKEIWLRVRPNETEIAELIGMDMDIHTIKAIDVKEFSQRPQAMSLILTGLTEIHSNAEMFGGIESTSFKIKWKQINKRGKAILAELDK